MKKVYICSPLRGDIESNLKKAKEHCQFAVIREALPICPHLYCTQFLNDNIPQQREIGIKIGLELLEICNELWYWRTETGGISEGMQQEIERAKELEIPVYDFSKER